MPRTPPDPFNAEAFFSFVDDNPPKDMRTNELEQELLYWAEWLNARDYVGKPPVPGKSLKIAGQATEAIGVVTACFGLLGLASSPISAAATLIGFGVFAIGTVIENAGKTRTAPANAALERVRIRQATILYELDPSSRN